MGINHRCLNLCVPQNFLERQNIAAVHHEMTGEGVAQRMNSLAVRNIRCDRFDDIANQWIPVLEESLKDYAKRTNQAVNTVKRQADRGSIPINQDEKNSRRTVNLFALFLKTIRSAEKYVQMTK